MNAYNCTYSHISFFKLLNRYYRSVHPTIVGAAMLAICLMPPQRAAATEAIGIMPAFIYDEGNSVRALQLPF
jgi:hypothetical protein